jgi:hypothetical protein
MADSSAERMATLKVAHSVALWAGLTADNWVVR